MNVRWVPVGLALILAGACAAPAPQVSPPPPASGSRPAGTSPGASPPPPLPTATPAVHPAATATPEPSPPPPTVTSPPTSDLDPFSIPGLRARSYPGGAVERLGIAEEEPGYTSYVIAYPSDGLRITGVMKVPRGDGPFPVVVLNHGYFAPSAYTSGAGTHGMADRLAAAGYLTLASDYRGLGGSEDDGRGERGHRVEYAVDVLNLIGSILSIPQADPQRVGMWGHSMGGEVALRVAEVTDRLKALVLWAPTSAWIADNASFYGGGSTSRLNGLAYGRSPGNFLQYIAAPISLHQGDRDREVNPEWSVRLSVTLAEAGKTVELHQYPGQGHNFAELGWGEIAPRTVQFFDRYVQGDG